MIIKFNVRLELFSRRNPGNILLPNVWTSSILSAPSWSILERKPGGSWGCDLTRTSRGQRPGCSQRLFLY